MLSPGLRELLEAVRRLPAEEQLALWSVVMRRQPAYGELRPSSAANIAELRFREGLRCPHCRSEEVVRYGRLGAKQRYRCKGCGRTFNDSTGTPMHRTLYPEKWPLLAQALRDGLTIEKTSKLLGVSMRTAFAWRHKMLDALRSLPEPVLSGIVEADEAFFLRSEKGNRNLSRRARRRGGRARQRGRSREHVYALIARDRDGRTLSKKLDRITKDAVLEALGSRIRPSSKLCSDGLGAYKAVASALGLEHIAVNLSRGRRVIRELYHIQNVNAFHSRLHGWLARFRGVATKYLDNYLCWFTFVDAIRLMRPEAASEFLLREGLRLAA